MSSKQDSTEIKVADDSANDKKTFKAVYDEEEGLTSIFHLYNFSIIIFYFFSF